MELTEYNVINETSTTLEKEAIFITEDLGNVKTFEAIVDKFNNYRFNEHIDFLRNDHDCQSHSTISFSINIKHGGSEIKHILFCARLDIVDRTEVDYITFPMSGDIRNIELYVDGCLKYKNYDKIIVKAKMEIKFYKNRSLDILDQYEDVESDNEYNNADEPAIVERSFTSDNCSVCLSMKPNILNIPCLHLAICCSCEEAGELLRCVVCRKRIGRKIKI